MDYRCLHIFNMQMLVNIWKYLEDLNELSFKEHPQGICRASKGVADLKRLGITEVDIA